MRKTTRSFIAILLSLAMASSSLVSVYATEIAENNVEAGNGSIEVNNTFDAPTVDESDNQSSSNKDQNALTSDSNSEQGDTSQQNDVSPETKPEQDPQAPVEEEKLNEQIDPEPQEDSNKQDQTNKDNPIEENTDTTIPSEGEDATQGEIVNEVLPNEELTEAELLDQSIELQVKASFNDKIDYMIDQFDNYYCCPVDENGDFVDDLTPKEIAYILSTEDKAVLKDLILFYLENKDIILTPIDVQQEIVPEIVDPAESAPEEVVPVPGTDKNANLGNTDDAITDPNTNLEENQDQKVPEKPTTPAEPQTETNPSDDKETVDKSKTNNTEIVEAPNETKEKSPSDSKTETIQSTDKTSNAEQIDKALAGENYNITVKQKNLLEKQLVPTFYILLGNGPMVVIDNETGLPFINETNLKNIDNQFIPDGWGEVALYSLRPSDITSSTATYNDYVAITSNSTIRINGTVTINAPTGRAAIQVEPNITLTLDGTGKLIAKGGNSTRDFGAGAGIGSSGGNQNGADNNNWGNRDYDNSYSSQSQEASKIFGNIIINGDLEIEAYGGNSVSGGAPAAGIGCGGAGPNSNAADSNTIKTTITIRNTKPVKAYGGKGTDYAGGGAGMCDAGATQNSNGMEKRVNYVTINICNGANVESYGGNGGQYAGAGAGIGGGGSYNCGGYAPHINIEDGATVVAVGGTVGSSSRNGMCGAGIGFGGGGQNGNTDSANCGSLNITEGAKVYAYSQGRLSSNGNIYHDQYENKCDRLAIDFGTNFRFDKSLNDKGANSFDRHATNGGNNYGGSGSTEMNHYKGTANVIMQTVQPEGQSVMPQDGQTVYFESNITTPNAGGAKQNFVSIPMKSGYNSYATTVCADTFSVASNSSQNPFYYAILQKEPTNTTGYLIGKWNYGNTAGTSQTQFVSVNDKVTDYVVIGTNGTRPIPGDTVIDNTKCSIIINKTIGFGDNKFEDAIFTFKLEKLDENYLVDKTFKPRYLVVEIKKGKQTSNNQTFVCLDKGNYKITELETMRYSCEASGIGDCGGIKVPKQELQNQGNSKTNVIFINTDDINNKYGNISITFTNKSLNDSYFSDTKFVDNSFTFNPVDPPKPPVTDKITVSFNTQAADVTAPESQTINIGDTLIEVPKVSRPGYTFNGWYTMPNGGEKITASTTFNTNTTVYAHWTEASSGNVIPCGPGPGSLWGGGGGSQGWAVRVQNGSAIIQSGRFMYGDGKADGDKANRIGATDSTANGEWSSVKTERGTSLIINGGSYQRDPAFRDAANNHQHEGKFDIPNFRDGSKGNDGYINYPNDASQGYVTYKVKGDIDTRASYAVLTGPDSDGMYNAKYYTVTNRSSSQNISIPNCTVVLLNDINVSTTHFEIKAENVTFDLNGHMCKMFDGGGAIDVGLSGVKGSVTIRDNAAYK